MAPRSPIPGAATAEPHVIAAARVAARLGQRDLAQLAGVDRRTIERFEVGAVSVRNDTYNRIVQALAQRGVMIRPHINDASISIVVTQKARIAVTDEGSLAGADDGVRRHPSSQDATAKS